MQLDWRLMQRLGHFQITISIRPELQHQANERTIVLLPENLDRRTNNVLEVLTGPLMKIKVSF